MCERLPLHYTCGRVVSKDAHTLVVAFISKDYCYTCSVPSLGELSLDGAVRSVRGALSAAIAARENGLTAIAVPETNAREAAVVDGLDVFALKSLPQAVDLVNSPESFQPRPGKCRRDVKRGRAIQRRPTRRSRTAGGETCFGSGLCRRAQHFVHRAARRGKDDAGQAYPHDSAADVAGRGHRNHQDSQRGGNTGKFARTDRDAAISFAASHHQRCGADRWRSDSTPWGSVSGTQRSFVSG